MVGLQAPQGRHYPCAALITGKEELASNLMHKTKASGVLFDITYMLQDFNSLREVHNKTRGMPRAGHNSLEARNKLHPRVISD